MNRLTYWYSGLSRKTKIAITAGGIAVAVIVAVAILYMVFKPTMVEVRYGTIVWDPIDGHVWEDNTETKLVEASEAGNYEVEYVTKYSPEHEQEMKEKEELEAQQEQELAQSSGYQALEAAIPSDTIAQLNSMQQDIETMGQDVVKGMELAQDIYEAQVTLMDYRNQVNSMQLPPELQELKQQAIQVFDMCIKACDLYIEAIASGDLNLVDQANLLLQQATAIVQSYLPSY